MMIMSVRSCKCGKHEAGLSIDCIIPEEVVAAVYCPEESPEVSFDKESMIEDNGWIIEYDMEVARFYGEHAHKSPEEITPEFLFLEGWASWTGMTPTDVVDLQRERNEIIRLRDKDVKKYFEEFRKWGNSRAERMRKAGWKKALKPS
jgi:hypothetical protein